MHDHLKQGDLIRLVNPNPAGVPQHVDLKVAKAPKGPPVPGAATTLARTPAKTAPMKNTGKAQPGWKVHRNTVRPSSKVPDSKTVEGKLLHGGLSQHDLTALSGFMTDSIFGGEV